MVVQFFRPCGRRIASTRFGYNEQNLSCGASPEGIAANAETPVTVYLCGHVDTAGSIRVFFSHLGENDDQSKPDLQFEYSDNSRLCRGYQQLRRRKRRFLFGGNISSRYPTHSITNGGMDTVANYRSIRLERLPARTPFLETRPPSRWVLAIGE